MVSTWHVHMVSTHLLIANSAAMKYSKHYIKAKSTRGDIMPRVYDCHCLEKEFNSCGTGAFAKTQKPCPYFAVVDREFYCHNKKVVT